MSKYYRPSNNNRKLGQQMSCDFRSSDCHETRPNLERKEGNTLVQDVKQPEASLNCWPRHDHTLDY